MELWDLYDQNCKPLGKTHIRGEKIPAGEYHIVVDIVSVNQKNQLLITKRHPHKKFGNQWETTGGSAVAGENPVKAAQRELYEETGLKANENELLYCGTLVRYSSRCIHIFYLYKGDFSAEDFAVPTGGAVVRASFLPAAVERTFLSVPHRIRHLSGSGGAENPFPEFYPIRTPPFIVSIVHFTIKLQNSKYLFPMAGYA